MTSDAPGRRVSAEERQFGLVLALIATDTGLTKSQILSTIEGYAHRYVPGGDNATLERQFERDKDDLRDLGLPLDTIDQLGADGDTKLQRYRIARETYPLPDDIVFTPAELALLALAGQVWREGSLSDDSRRALTKLRGLGVVSGDAVLGVAPTLRALDRAHAPVTQAITRGRQIEFSYVKPGDAAPAPRIVTPLALVQHEGRWHLHGFDETRGDDRTFLLQRVVSAVRIRTAPASRTPRIDEADQVLAELAELWQRTTARVRVTPGSEADIVLRNRRGTVVERGTLVVHTTDYAVLADELSQFGDDVQVAGPPELVQAVTARWQQVVDAHD